MPNYGQYGTDSTWKSRFDTRQSNTLIRNFHKSDGYCVCDVTSPSLAVTEKVPLHIFNTSIKTVGVKQLACHPSYPIVNGSLIDYIDGEKYLLVDSDTHQSVQAFGRIYLANSTLKWIDDNGNTKETYAVENESLGTQDNARQLPQGEGRRKVWIQKNVDTNKLSKNFRFIFGGIEAFKITFIDNWSKKDLILLGLELTQILPEDDLVNNIAYNGQPIYTPTPVNEIQFSLNELRVIEGYSKSISVSEVDVPSTTFTFTITGLPPTSYEIVSSTGNSITVKCKASYYEGTLRATSTVTPTQYAEVPIILRGLI